MTGEIPELGGLSNLKELSLYSNRLTGEIPPELGGLSNLTFLSLYSNQLTGEIPPELGGLSNLTGLDLWNNQLTGGIPPELGGLSNLTDMSLHSNQLTGEIPSELGDLSNLERLYLYSNQLTGEIPSELGRLSNLTELSLLANQLTGEIPSELGDLSNLTKLWLYRNRLTGEIPSDLGRLSNLTELWLENNQLTGEIPPELGGLSNLRRLYLAPNQLSGCIPEGLRDIASNDLGQLNLPDCGSVTEPEAPTGLTATADGQTQIDLSWTAPSDNGGATITGYKIEVSTNGSSWSDLVANTNSTSTSYTHSGLAAGSARHYRVSAINSAGTGPASNVDNATTGAAPAPDLVVDTPTVDARAPAAGARFTLSATVRNQGNGSSAATTLRYYRSTNSTITTGDTEVGTDSVFRLDASGSGDESLSLNAPSTPGTYYYGACVDSVSDESDTTNNCSPAATVTVERTNQPPQLTGDVDDKVVELGESFTVDLSGLFTDPDGDEITSYGFTYRTGGILAGFVNTKTGILSLSAIAVGETIVAVDASDSNGQSGDSEDLFKVTVVAAEAATDTQQDTGACATGGAVPDAANNPGLVSDCEALLAGKDTLVGTGTLNWSADVPMVNWDGVSVGNSPTRVLGLYLDSNQLTGEIPPELGACPT